MRSLNRIVWLLCWGTWVLLGIGLYRELPREIGPRVCKLQLPRDSHQLLGFIGSSNEFAIISQTMSPYHTLIAVRDAKTGSLCRKIYGPAMADCFLPPRRTAESMLLPANNVPKPTEPGHVQGLFLLDLAKGEWENFSDTAASDAAIHPDGRSICSVVPLHTGLNGATIFSIWRQPLDAGIWRGQSRSHVLGSLAFIDGEFAALTGDDLRSHFQTPSAKLNSPDRRGQAMVAALKQTMSGNAASKRIAPGTVLPSPPNIEGKPPSTLKEGKVELNLFTETEVTTTKLDFAKLPQAPSFIPEGSLVYGDRELPSWMVRFGLIDMAVVDRSSREDDSLDDNGWNRWSSRITATNGPMAFCQNNSLWNVDERKLVWRARRHESMEYSPGRDSFQVVERWDGIWGDWFPKLAFATRSLRKLQDGSLIVRTASHVLPPTDHWNAAGTLAVANDGTVYRLPFKVNYTLLAICQAILAAPLVMVWVIVRWRRRRRASLPMA
jgi:hypothetical protein